MRAEVPLLCGFSQEVMGYFRRLGVNGLQAPSEWGASAPESCVHWPTMSMIG